MPPKSSKRYDYPSEVETGKVVDKWMAQFPPGEPIRFDKKNGSRETLAEFKELVKRENGGTLPDNATDAKLRNYLSVRISKKSGIRIQRKNANAKQIGEKRTDQTRCVECETKQVSLAGTMCTECTAQTLNIEMSDNGRVCIYDDPFASRRRVYVDLSNLPQEEISCYIGPGRGSANPTCRFPTSLSVSTSLPLAVYDAKVDQLVVSRVAVRDRASYHNQVLRDEKAAQAKLLAEQALKIFKATGGDQSRLMLIKNRLMMRALPFDAIDYNQVKMEGAPVGQDFLHFSPVPPDCLEGGCLMGNYFLSDATRTAVPHLTPGQIFNTDRKLWVTPAGFDVGKDFFHRHHRGTYPLGSTNPYPGSKGYYFAYYVYSGNRWFSHVNQLCVPGGTSVTKNHALLCFLSFPKNWNGTFLCADLVVAYKGEEMKIVMIGGHDVNILINADGTTNDPDLYADLMGVWHKKYLSKPGAAGKPAAMAAASGLDSDDVIDLSAIADSPIVPDDNDRKPAAKPSPTIIDLLNTTPPNRNRSTGRGQLVRPPLAQTSPNCKRRRQF